MAEFREPYSNLPAPVLELMRSAGLSEFATVSAAGVPIDTPVGSFHEPNGIVSIATGVSYPSKAERARRNPKVGLLMEGFPHEPVVLVAGIATVRDANVQANVDRYLPEIAAYLDNFAAGYPWETTREAVHYWAKIFIDVTPKTIWWWDKAGDVDGAPHRWDAPATTLYPASDPAPATAASAPIDWSPPPWRDQAEEVMAERLPAHLTLLDADGFPLPFRAQSVERTADGFALQLAAGVPWRVEGKATLCFIARSTFVGTVTATGGGVEFRVERALPVMPIVKDLAQIWAPGSQAGRKLAKRLAAELARRGQPVPTLPAALPAPTHGSLLRAERSRKIYAELAKQGDGGALYIRRD
jgi:hypothetical protein